MYFEAPVYAFLITLAFVLKAFFYLGFLAFKLFIFYFITIMIFNKLYKKGETIIVSIKPSAGSEISRKETDILFKNSGYLKQVYVRILIMKFAVYSLFFLYGIYDLLEIQPEKKYLLYIFFLLHILLELGKVFLIFIRMKNNDYKIISMELNGREYYSAVIKTIIGKGKEKKLSRIVTFR